MATVNSHKARMARCPAMVMALIAHGHLPQHGIESLFYPIRRPSQVDNARLLRTSPFCNFLEQACLERVLQISFFKSATLIPELVDCSKRCGHMEAVITSGMISDLDPKSEVQNSGPATVGLRDG